MRNLVTFILRLWIDPQANPPTWEGQIECVANGARAHVRGPLEVANFIEVHAISSPGTESSPAGPVSWPTEEATGPHRPQPEQRSAR